MGKRPNYIVPPSPHTFLQYANPIRSPTSRPRAHKGRTSKSHPITQSLLAREKTATFARRRNPFAAAV